MKKVLFVSLILFIPILVVLNNAYSIGFDLTFYHNEFKQIKTYDRVENADAIIANTLNYMNGIEDLKYFEGKEAQHMQDVKKVVMKFALLNLILTLAVATIILRLRNFTLIYYSFIFAFILLLLIIFALYFFDFSLLFEKFHSVLFDAGTWMFPSDDLLIKLFPLNFFSDAARIILLNSLYQLFVVCLAMFAVEKWVLRSKDELL
jgi:integral membrane protein (TIGR01906 family)